MSQRNKALLLTVVVLLAVVLVALLLFLRAALDYKGTVEAITIQELGPELRLTFTGDGFLYHMVRILVGTLLAVGRGEKSPRDMADILASQDRPQAGETVPACGLCLEAVHYTR